VIGDARTFDASHLNLLHHMQTGAAAAEVELSWFFWLTNDALSSSKGVGYHNITDDRLRSMVDLFSPKFVELHGGTPFHRNPNCVWPGGTHLLDKTGQTTEKRIVETVLKYRECFRKVEADEIETGLKYDAVLRLRPDVFFFAPLPEELLRPSVPVFPNGGHACDMPCFNNHLAFLPRRHASVYFNAVEHYERCRGTLRIKLQIEHYTRHLDKTAWGNAARTLAVSRARGTTPCDLFGYRGERLT